MAQCKAPACNCSSRGLTPFQAQQVPALMRGVCTHQTHMHTCVHEHTHTIKNKMTTSSALKG